MSYEFLKRSYECVRCVMWVCQMRLESMPGVSIGVSGASCVYFDVVRCVMSVCQTGVSSASCVSFGVDRCVIECLSGVWGV